MDISLILSRNLSYYIGCNSCTGGIVLVPFSLFLLLSIFTIAKCPANQHMTVLRRKGGYLDFFLFFLLVLVLV